MKPYGRGKRASRMSETSLAWRRLSATAIFGVLAVVLLVKTLDMQILHSEFFERQGDARQLRTISISAHRGDIVDRNGEPFAVSAPVNSIWVNPQDAVNNLDKLVKVANLLSLDAISLKRKIKRNTQTKKTKSSKCG